MYTLILGEKPLGESTSKQIALQGCHQEWFVHIVNNTSVDCSGRALDENTIFELVQIKPDTIALKSLQTGKYLSGTIIDYCINFLF